MLNKQFYSWEELETILKAQFTKRNNRAKLIKRNIEPFYSFNIVKKGRAQIGINIIHYKEKQKSKFIQLCESIALVQVKFPKDQFAESLLKYLFEGNRTMESNEMLARELGVEEHTVGKYIKLFREYGILPKPMPILYEDITDHEKGEIITLKYDPNLYTYYGVCNQRDYRKETTRKKYLEQQEFIRNRISEYLFKGLDKKEANVKAYSDCAMGYGVVVVKAFSKVPTAKAFYIFREYFNLPIPMLNVTEDAIKIF